MKQPSKLFQGLLPINKSQITIEILAGLTLAALAIPEVLGYTKISGTPLITGLYTLLIPVILFAVFGSSRHLVVGADSATAAILAATLVGFAPKYSAEYTALAGLLALICAGLLILARIIGLGFMADFLSRTVLIGFLTGVGIQVAFSQIHGMIASSADLWISMVAIGMILGIGRISKKVPGALIAVIVAIVLGRFFHFNTYGVEIIGAIPQGLPVIGLPQVAWSFSLLQKLLPTAFSMLVVILAQSAATSRAYAARHDEDFNEELDMIGLGMANLGAALSGNFVVNGSPTKTEMVDSAGGRSQLPQLVMSLVVLLVLLFFTGLLSTLPNSVLAAVVFVIGLRLIDIKGMHRIWQQRPAEFWVALVTTIVVVFIGVEQGIVIAMVLSLFEHVRRSYQSRNVVLVMDKVSGAWRLLPVASAQEAQPGLLIYRFAHTIYYANAQQLFNEITNLTSDHSLSWLCIDASAIADVDFTAGDTLREVYHVVSSKHVRIVWTNVIDSVHDQLDRYGLVELYGKDAFYQNISDVLKAYASLQK